MKNNKQNKLEQFYNTCNTGNAQYNEDRFTDGVRFLIYSLFDKRNYVKTHVEYIDEETGEIIDISIADRYPSYKRIANHKTIQLAKWYTPTTKHILNHALTFLKNEIDLVCHTPSVNIHQKVSCIMQFDLNKLKKLVKHLKINYSPAQIKLEKKEIFKRYEIRRTSAEYYAFVEKAAEKYNNLNADIINTDLLTDSDYEEYREQQWERWKTDNDIKSTAKYSSEVYAYLKKKAEKPFRYTKLATIKQEFDKEYNNITDRQYDSRIFGNPKSGIQTRMYFGLSSQNRVLRKRIMDANNLVELDLKAAHISIGFSIATGHMTMETIKSVYSWMKEINPRLYNKQMNHLEKYVDIASFKDLLTEKEILKLEEVFINGDFRQEAGLGKIESLIALFCKNHQIKGNGKLKQLENDLVDSEIGRKFLQVMSVLKQYDDKDHSHFSTTCLIIEQIIIQTMMYRGQQAGIGSTPIHDAIAFDQNDNKEMTNIYNTVLKEIGLLNPTKGTFKDDKQEDLIVDTKEGQEWNEEFQDWVPVLTKSVIKKTERSINKKFYLENRFEDLSDDRILTTELEYQQSLSTIRGQSFNSVLSDEDLKNFRARKN